MVGTNEYAAENGWLENSTLLFGGWGLFCRSYIYLVSFREGSYGGNEHQIPFLVVEY